MSQDPKLAHNLGKSLRRSARSFVRGLAIIVLSFFAGAALRAFTNPLPIASIRANEQPPSAAGSGYGGEQPQTITEWLGRPAEPNRRINVLIIGVDFPSTDPRHQGPVSRSDTLILVSFDPQRNRIAALSIPRDTRAQIPRVGEAKINEAYPFGGPRLTIETVENLLDVPVHYYVSLRLESFIRLIDAIGGVELDVDRDIRSADPWTGAYITLTRGRHRLDGKLAMHYVRFRHDPLADIGRVQRQQRMLRALFHKVRASPTIPVAEELLRMFFGTTETNLPVAEVLALGAFAMHVDESNLQVFTLPGRFAPIYWEPDGPKIQDLLIKYFSSVHQGSRSSELRPTASPNSHRS